MEQVPYPRPWLPPLPPPTPHAFPAENPQPCPCSLRNLNHAFAMLGADYGTWVGGFALCFLVPAIVAAIGSFGITFALMGSMTPTHAPGLEFYVLTVGYGILISSFSVLLQAGYMRLIILRMRGYQASVSDTMNMNGQAGPLILYGVAYSVVTQLLFLIPSLMMPRFDPNNPVFDVVPVLLAYGVIAFVLSLVFTLVGLVPAIIVDQRVGFGRALNLSLQVMSPRFLAGTGVLFLGGLVSIVGALACGIGIILTGPILYLLLGSFYYDSFIAPSKQEAA